MTKKNWLSTTALLLATISISAYTCAAQVEGNGNVVKEERKISDFSGVTVSSSINLLLSQGSAEKVVVEADENIVPYIRTEVSGGILRIGVKGSINNTKRMNVYVTVKELKTLEAGSGSRIKTENKIQMDDLKIAISSGSNIKAELDCGNLEIHSSSGCSGVISGFAKSIKAEGSSGSSLNASGLKAEKGDVSVSSGSSMAINVTKELRAHASSGGHISVTGNPSVRDIDSSSGGSVHFK